MERSALQKLSKEWIFPGNRLTNTILAAMTHAFRAPVIGLTTQGRNDRDEFSLYTSYVDAVRRAGGVPILLPSGEAQAERVLHLVDGLVFTGGGDIHPECYGGMRHPEMYKLDDERDAFELELARLALQSNVSILGICRGMQILSVVSGTGLIPHVPDEFGFEVIHREVPRLPTRHCVSVVPDSRLSQIVNWAEMEIVSWHHQAIASVPEGWTPAAYAADGLVEALEHTHHPWAIAVQWHPEMSAAEDPLQQALFNAFVQAAATVDRVSPITDARHVPQPEPERRSA